MNKVKPSKNKINNFFDKVFVLNMESESWRNDLIEKTFENVNINYELFTAVNGRSSRYDRLWELYHSREIVTYYEVSYRKKFIESRGALGHLKSMEKLFTYAIKNKLESLLIFENDCLFDNDFSSKIDAHLDYFSKNKWKIIQFGASDYGLSNRDVKSPYYSPLKFSTCGFFATAIHNSCFIDILREVSKIETPSDVLPLGNIYEKYPDESYVIYPNIVIADVTGSSIRDSRNQVTHSHRMKWQLDNFKELNQ